MKVYTVDARRELVIPGDEEETLLYASQFFCSFASKMLDKRERFSVALSGGSTPEALYRRLSKQPLAWSRILLFWSDERAVGPEHAESNYRMAMEAGFGSLALPPEHLFRMKGEKEPEEAALEYDKLMRQALPKASLDLILLGMGEDGHTASLFPFTHGLHAPERLAIANYLPEKKCWRLSLTFGCFEKAGQVVFLVMGEKKAERLSEVLFGPLDFDRLPAQRVGSEGKKALWIVDRKAAKKLSL